MSGKQHSRLGASSSHRWMNCPGSVALEETQPPSTSKYAAEGTAAHELAARCLAKKVDAEVYLGTVIEGFTVDEDMADAVQVFVDTVRARQHRGTKLFIEQGFDLAPLSPPEPMWGTGDAVTWDKKLKHLYVDDYKHGKGVTVDATENSQLMYYALGAVLALGEKPNEITVTIVQPRAAHPDGIIRSYTFSWDELVAFKQTLFDAARATQKPDAPLVVGEHCQFCRASAVCPAQHQHAVTLAQDAFFEPPAPATLDAETILLIMERGPLVEQWLKDVREYVQNVLVNGGEVPGWKLVQKKTHRQWVDEDAVKAWAAQLGIDEATLMKSKLDTPAGVERVIKKLFPAGARPELPNSLVTKPEGGYTLAPEHDSRPAIAQDASDVFAALPPSEDEPNEA